jgi:NitT/TauT family transport system substrate-binding protein
MERVREKESMKMGGKLIKLSYILLAMIIIGVGVEARNVIAAETIVQVNYRLKWLFNTSVVGDLYADTNGFFKNKGLNTTVKEGGPERDAIRELELGYAQFGVASADQVIRALSKGSPVVVIAQIFQINPLQWIYRTKKLNIKRLDKLKGKVIGITYGGNDETIMRTLLAKENIVEKEIKFFSVRYDYTPFYLDRVDLWPVYRNSQGITIASKLRTNGEEISYVNPAEFGVEFVANSIVTSKGMLTDHPQIVEKFVDALLMAWEESLKPENKQRALKIIGKYDKDTPPDLLEQQLDVTRRLVKPSLRLKIGTINVQAWKQTEGIMLDQKLILEPVYVEKYLKQYVK